MAAEVFYQVKYFYKYVYTYDHVSVCFKPLFAELHVSTYIFHCSYTPLYTMYIYISLHWYLIVGINKENCGFPNQNIHLYNIKLKY